MGKESYSQHKPHLDLLATYRARCRAPSMKGALALEKLWFCWGESQEGDKQGTKMVPCEAPGETSPGLWGNDWGWEDQSFPWPQRASLGR